jgi:hypothetical protein
VRVDGAPNMFNLQLFCSLPKAFALGARDYDPVKLGFVVDTACSAQDCLVDTSETGAGNGGHLWGTDLSDSDRMALLEYLKTY